MGREGVPVAKPKPDIDRFLSAVAGRIAPDRPPMVEYIVDSVVMRPIVEDLGRQWVPGGPDRQQQKAWLDNFITFWWRCGYDFVRLEQSLALPGPSVEGEDATTAGGQRSWADEHHGAIASREDFERYPWPELTDEAFWPYEYIAEHLPEGMGLLSCHGGGIFEHVSRLLSLEGLCIALYEDPELVRAVTDRVGDLILRYHKRLLQIPALAAIFQGDDMGFRSATLISPEHMRKYFLPWHARYAAQAHAHGRPYFLHSCGNLEELLPDLIDDVSIDAKHSYENAILPADQMKRRFGDRIGVLGGVDVDILARRSPPEVRAEVRRIINACAPGGRFAIGSGNSIPSYVPVENYLAMLAEALTGI